MNHSFLIVLKRTSFHCLSVCLKTKRGPEDRSCGGGGKQPQPLTRCAFWNLISPGSVGAMISGDTWPKKKSRPEKRDCV